MVQSRTVSEHSLTSQLIRILPQEHHPDIKDNDVIITADVDAFIMTPDILRPLDEFGDKKVWVWQYETTATNQGTFAMSFIGWRK